MYCVVLGNTMLVFPRTRWPHTNPCSPFFLGTLQSQGETDHFWACFLLMSVAIVYCQLLGSKEICETWRSGIMTKKQSCPVGSKKIIIEKTHQMITQIVTHYRNIVLT
jgi:hypothetical protein